MSGELTHEQARAKHDDFDAIRREAKNEGAGAGVAAAASTGSISKLPPSGVARLQRSAGSRAVSRALRAERLAVQRHEEGAELPEKDQDKTEVEEKATAEIPAEAQGTGGESPPAEGGGATGGGTEGAGGTNGAAPAEPTVPATPAPAGGESAEPTQANDAPARTRTADEEKKQKADASASGKDFTDKQKLTPGAMSLAGAQKILMGAYGGIKSIVSGKIEILADQPACSAKYDEVCIRDHVKRKDGSAWKAGDCAKDDAAAGVTTEGFAWKGVVYVNGKTTLVTATAHEILHNNTAKDFRGKVGEAINEGSTEYFARKALKDAGVTVPATTAYPDQVEITTSIVAFVGEGTLLTAYFGGADSLIKEYEKKSNHKWAELKTAATALDKAKVKDVLKYDPTTI